MSLETLFTNPTSEYRGKPFWSWNGKLEPEELRRQLRVFQRMGMGGAFLHSRVGLNTPYLGDEWFECIKACVEECREDGMEAWLYDEDRWPSGAAGGLVTKDPRYRNHFLVMVVVRPSQFREYRDVLGIWQGKLDGRIARDLQPVPPGSKPRPDESTVVLIFRDAEAASRDWYNGYTYLDTLSPEAVRAYIETTHDAYAREVGKDFGGVIPGIFTDEPNYGFEYDAPYETTANTLSAAVQWTPKLPAIFKKRFGYDLLPHLPELFFDVEGTKCSKARYDYRECVTSLFVNSFARQIGEWCGAKGFSFTGHVLYEEPLSQQVACVGDAMRFYEHMQAPGIDILTQHNRERDTAKQCVSVATQTGRKWVLSELYGVTGWDFPFEGHKAVGDWQAALGVNLRCQHLSFYTMKGEAKRDYPASILFQSPWWEHYRVVEDYFSRLNVWLTRGQPVRRLLVIHPIESMWMRYSPPFRGAIEGVALPPNSEDMDRLNGMLPSLRDWLLDAHIDFDYGDEEMLSRLGSVAQQGKDARIHLGKSDYDAVLVPPLLTMRKTTVDLLDRWVSAGGRAIFAGDVADHVDGSPSDLPTGLAARAQHVALEREAVVAAVEKSTRRVSIRDAAGEQIPSVLHMLRREGDRSILFVCNTDRGKDLPEVNIELAASGHVTEWNCVTGERFRIDSAKQGDQLSFQTTLPPTGSALFVIDHVEDAAIPAKPAWKERRRESLGASPTLQLGEPNVLVLDRPKFRIAGGDWQEPLEILKVDRRVRDFLKTPWRSGDMKQPWARPREDNPPRAAVELRYSFDVESLPRGPVALVLETPERFTVRLNESTLSLDNSDGWWVDPCLRRTPIDPALLRVGANVVDLSIDFAPSDDLEAAFLIGDFGARVEGTRCILTDSPVREGLGNWVERGLPFYGGSATYRFAAHVAVGEGERVFVAAPGFKGSVVRVLVEGRPAGYLAWAPYELDITGPLAGRSEVEIALEVFGSRRNCFGPLHQTNPDPWGVGPGNFTTDGADWSEDYVLKACGLLTPPELIYRR